MEVESTSKPSQPVDIYQWMAWLHKNRKQVVIGVLALFVVGAIASIVIWKNGQNEENANEQLFALPSVFGASERLTHPNADSLLKVAQEYPGTAAGEQAELLAASVLFMDGKYSEAEKQFNKFLTDRPNGPLASQATVGIAASLEAAGNPSEAIKKYQDIILRYPNENNVISPAKLTLARLFEEQNKPDQALRYYDELTKITNPYDPWAGEARERKEILLAKHPELKPKPIAPAVTTMPAPSTTAPNIIKIPPSQPATTIKPPSAPSSTSDTNKVQILQIPANSTPANSKPKP